MYFLGMNTIPALFVRDSSSGFIPVELAAGDYVKVCSDWIRMRRGPQLIYRNSDDGQDKTIEFPSTLSEVIAQVWNLEFAFALG